MSNDTKKPIDPIFAHHSVVRERPAQESSATTARKIPDMCDPDNRHRHECPICHEVEECDDTQCRFLYAGFGSQPGDELAPPASPVLCSGKSECMQAHISKMNENRPLVECVSCGGLTRWNVDGRCYECDKYDVPPRTADHPNSAPPEANPCDDGKEENTPEPQSGLDDVIAVYGDLLFAGIEAAAGLQIWLWEALSSTGVAALKESIGALRTEINKPDIGVLPLEPLTPEERAQDLVRWRRDIEEHNRGKEAAK